VRWLRAHADAYHLDTTRFVAWGTSAGAHLAAMLGVTRPGDSLEGAVGEHGGVSSAVRAVIGYHGAFNFLEPVPRRWTRWSSVGELLGCAVPECWERARLASPLTYVSFDDAPFFLAHGAADSVVPFSQAVVLDSVLRELRVPVEFVPLPDAPHGGPEFESPGMLGRIRAFLQRVFAGAPRDGTGTPAGEETGTSPETDVNRHEGRQEDGAPADSAPTPETPPEAAPPVPHPAGLNPPQ